MNEIGQFGTVFLGIALGMLFPRNYNLIISVVIVVGIAITFLIIDLWLELRERIRGE